MTGSLRPSLASLIVYAVCVVIVLSFILFEVLDIDGSDFHAMLFGRSVVQAVTTERVEDLKRSLIQMTSPISWALPSARLELPAVATAVEAVTDRPQPAVAPSLRSRIALPRASLSDTAPFA